MDSAYSAWITENVGPNPYGKCAETTIRMQKVFPELIRVRGHYLCYAWGEREHWWLKTADGTIIDPTKNQFPSRGNGGYIEWDESQPEPTGKCMNCGDYAYDYKTFCCEDCEISYMAHMHSYLGK